MLDAKKCFAKFWSPIINDPTVCQALENFHFGTTHEESSLRIVSRVQRNIARIDTFGSADVRVCELRCTIVRWSIGTMQRSDYFETRRLRRSIHETSFRDENEIKTRSKRELPFYSSPESLVRVATSFNFKKLIEHFLNVAYGRIFSLPFQG